MQIKIVSDLYKITPRSRELPVLDCATMLSNEKFCFQIAIYNEYNYSLIKPVLRGIDCDFRFREEKCVLADNPKIAGAPIYDDYFLKEERIPDILWEDEKLGVAAKADETVAVWCEIGGEKGLQAGVYDLTIQLIDSVGEQLADASLKLTVLPDKLLASDLIVTNWFHYDCLSDYYGVELWTEDYYRILKPYFENYFRHGNNTIYTPVLIPSLDTQIGCRRKNSQLVEIEKTGEVYRFGYEKLDRFLDFALQAGAEYFEISHLYTQWGAKNCPSVFVRENGEEKCRFGWEAASDSEEYQDFLSQFLHSLVAHLTKRGLLDRCLFHISDEPKAKDVELYQKHKALVKPLLKGAKIMDALSDYTFNGIVDLPVVSVRHAEPFIENGDEMMLYYCCDEIEQYVTNRLVSMPALRTRILGFQLYYVGAKGFLHWGFNYWYSFLSRGMIEPFLDRTGGGKFPAGDTFVVYAGNEKPVDSLRGEIYAKALEDYRLCKTVEAKRGRAAVIAVLSRCVKSLKEYAHEEEEYAKTRRELMKALED